MSINIIAAIGLGNELGFKNQLLCHLPSDLKRFKELTTGGFVLMGSNTFHSIGKPLPHRHNLVLTKKAKHNLPSDVFVYHSVKDILREYDTYSEKQVDLWVIGGQSIYEQFIDKADNLYLTIIDHVFDEADAFFPRFSISDWKPIERIDNKADDKHEYDYYFVTYRRRINTK